VLVVRGLRKSFGGLRAVDGVDLNLARHEITGLIGPNGFRQDDVVQPDRRHQSPAATAASPSPAAAWTTPAAPPARTPDLPARNQLPRLFGSLTVVENLVVPERRFAFGRLVDAEGHPANATARWPCWTTSAWHRMRDSSPADLSYGQRKLVELAQVLWLDPVLVMLDEPAAGISPALSERLAEMVGRCTNAGSASCCGTRSGLHRRSVPTGLRDGARAGHQRTVRSPRSARTWPSSTPISVTPSAGVRS